MRQLYLPMRVWDLPTRLFHWTVAVLVGISWGTQELGWMQIHFYAGYLTLSLLLFRLVWGFIGSDTARFRSFLKSPLAAFRHLTHITRREADTEIGHNAAGGWMVLVLLGLLAVQAATGLCSNDDISLEGPLARWVGKETSDTLTHYHHLIFNFILAAIVLHVLAVLAYAVLKGHDLVRPMITGKKRLPGATRAPRMASPVLALAIWIVALGAVVALVKWAP
jgi:cytochrome b